MWHLGFAFKTAVPQNGSIAQSLIYFAENFEHSKVHKIAPTVPHKILYNTVQVYESVYF